VRGVVNLRGVIVPVVDLRALLGVDASRLDDFTVVIVLNVLHRVVGVVVDSVSDVVELAAEQILPAPEMRGAPDAGSVLGIATVSPPGGSGGGPGGRMLIVTDIERLLRGAGLGEQAETTLH
jgi:purine-binding chemotaxis protein CheW